MPPRKLELHGMSGHPLYHVWRTMRQRCFNPNSADYPNYGARGISVCDRWESFCAFRDDMLPSWEPGLTIERINNEEGYSPENCRFATRSEQRQNQREAEVYGAVPFRGVTKTASKKFQAQIWNGHTVKSLGTFETPEEANAVFEAAKEEINGHQNFEQERSSNP